MRGEAASKLPSADVGVRARQPRGIGLRGHPPRASELLKIRENAHFPEPHPVQERHRQLPPPHELGRLGLHGRDASVPVAPLAWPTPAHLAETTASVCPSDSVFG